MEKIGVRAFAGSGLERFALPPSTLSLGSLAFFGCKNLKTVDFNQGLMEIGPLCFLGSNVQNLQLPENIDVRPQEIGLQLPKVPFLIIPDGQEIVGPDDATNPEAVILYIPRSVT